jgi:hypothetical protein
MRILGEDNEEYSKTLGNLSNMFLKLGDYEEAKQGFLKAN